MYRFIADVVSTVSLRPIVDWWISQWQLERDNSVGSGQVAFFSCRGAFDLVWVASDSTTLTSVYTYERRFQ